MAAELSAEAAREIRQLEKSKEKFRRLGNPSEEAATCNRLGELLAAHGRFGEALEQHREELRILEVAEDTLGCAVAHRKIGERLAELRRFPQALEHQRRHLSLAQSLGDPVEQQRAWATIGRTFLLMAESTELSEFPEFSQGSQGTSGISGALSRALEAFKASLEIVDTQLEGILPCQELAQMRSRLFLNLGLVQDSLGNSPESSKLLCKSVQLAEQSQVLEDQFRAHFNLGLLQQRNSEFSQALKSLSRARDCGRNLGEPQLQGEAEAALGQVLLSLGDFEGARRALRRALALGNPESRQLRRNLRHASRVSRCLSRLSRGDPADPSESLSLLERLGDSLARLGDFRRAAEFYQKQLSLAESLGAPGRDLAVIHVSLATTFRDLGEHSKALQHFQRELELRKGEPLEECGTWLNVALALEDLGSSPAQVVAPLRNALGCAQAAGDSRLQRRVLRRLRVQQLRAGDPQGAQETQNKLGENPENEDEEEEEEESEESESESELSESEDEDEDLEGYPKSVPGRRRSNRQWSRRNERGETPLHRACIEGDTKRVRLYLDQGHPVNPRDYCGWTPLHEAANHGHLEIVRVLLSRGAALDDPGGPGCEGITPLHDALASGRFPVAQLLVHSGANVTARNAKGQTPLETLQEWLENFGAELDAETWESVRDTQRLLREKMGQKAPPDHSQIPNFGTGKRQRVPEAEKEEKTPNLGKSQKPNTENPKFPSENPNFSSENPKFPPKNPNFSSENPKFPSENSKTPQISALIPEAEFLELEDWLEDDLGPSRKKPRKNFREFQEFREPKIPSLGNPKVSSSPESQNLGDEPKEQQEILGDFLDSSKIPEFSGNGPNSSKVPEFSGNGPNSPQILRIRIRIQDDVFLIPVEPSADVSVSVLSLRAAERFSLSSGLFPQLRLRKAGALLAPHDPVSAVLGDHDQVEAEILGWDLPPLPERYQRICSSLGLVPFPPLLRLLRQQAQSCRVEIPSGLCIPPAQIPALLRALRLHEALRELRLSHCAIGESGMAELGLTVLTLPRLARLGLPGIGMGAHGLRRLCSPGNALQSLQELDLSMNPLGDDGARALSEFLQRCPALTTLHLRGCGITEPFPIPEASLLRTLSLSCNVLGPGGLRRLLTTIPARSIRSLELASVIGRHRDTGDTGDIGSDLGHYLQQAGCALCHLSLAGNHLRDGDMEEVARCLPRCPSVISLELSANPGLGSRTLRNILEALEKREKGLDFLNMAGCSVGELDGTTWDKSRGKIRELRLPGRRLWNTP